MFFVDLFLEVGGCPQLESAEVITMRIRKFNLKSLVIIEWSFSITANASGLAQAVRLKDTIGGGALQIF